MIGTRLSHFRIVAKLGEGGMGVVYRAEDDRLRRPVALKVLPPELVANEERRLRFTREARAAAAVSHPNIAAIYEVDEAEGVVFIAMELVEGKTLRELIGGRPMPIKDALRMAAEMAEGLAHAHLSRVIHRDFKPDNVMVRLDQHVKILDFGLAKLVQEVAGVESSELSKLETISGEVSRAGKVLGTPAYMSPEQARGQPLDARSDIFAFGATLYEMVTGRVPFRGKTPADTLSAIIRDEPAAPSQLNAEVPLKLEEIIGKCLEKDPEDRYQHADDLVADLRRLRKAAESGAQAVRTPSGRSEAARPAPWAALTRRRSGRLALLAVVAVLLIAGGAAVRLSLRSPERFRTGDRVLVADLEGGTGRAELDTAIRHAIEGLLARSALLRVITEEERKDLIAARTGGRATRADLELARRLCADGACAGFLVAAVTPEGEGYRLEARLYGSRARRPLIVRTAAASSGDHLLAAIHELILEVRRAAGEGSDRIAATFPPTTQSLLAYQAFARAELETDPDQRVSLNRLALEIDPGFVEARAALAWAYDNLGDWRGFRKAAEEAYRRSSGLPDRMRLFYELTFLRASYDFDTELERLRLYRRLYPGDPEVVGELGNLYFQIYEDLVSAEEAWRAAYEMSPTTGPASSLSIILATQGKADEIERLVDDLRARGESENWALRFLLWAYKVRGDGERLKEVASQLEREPGVLKVYAANSMSIWLLASGQFAEAERATQALWRASQQTRDLDTFSRPGSGNHGSRCAGESRWPCSQARWRPRSAVSSICPAWPLSASRPDFRSLWPE